MIEHSAAAGTSSNLGQDSYKDDMDPLNYCGHDSFMCSEHSDDDQSSVNTCGMMDRIRH